MKLRSIFVALVVFVGMVYAMEYVSNWINIKPDNPSAVVPAEGVMFWNSSSQQVNVYDANLKLIGLDGRCDGDYLVYKVGSTYYAKNCSSGVIEFSGTNASVIFQYAVDNAHDNAKVVVMPNIYTASFSIPRPKNIHIDFSNSILIPESSYAIYILGWMSSENDSRVRIENVQILSDRTKSGIKIQDRFGVSLKNIILNNLNTALHFDNDAAWTEGYYLENVDITNCTYGIKFTVTNTSGTATGSFMNGVFQDVTINKCAYGIYLSNGAEVFNSKGNLVIWVPQDGVGIYTNGKLNSPLQISIEAISNVNTTGIRIGASGSFNGLELVLSDPDITILIDNPYNRWYSWKFLRAPWYYQYGDRFFARYYNASNDEMLAIGMNAANTQPVVYTFGHYMWFYDYTNSVDAEVRAREYLSSTPPYTCTASTEGGKYYDTDLHKPCYCNSTAWVLYEDSTTVCS